MRSELKDIAHKTHYEILGVTEQAPQEIVRAVYLAWMKTMRAHPDLGGDEEFARALNLAYETLRDPDQRQAYDSELRKSQRLKETRSRWTSRTSVHARVAVCIASSTEWQWAEVRDASAFGLRLRFAQSVHPETHITIALKGKGSPSIEAKVRWVRKEHAASSYEIGIHFFTPVPDILRRLHAEEKGFPP